MDLIKRSLAAVFSISIICCNAKAEGDSSNNLFELTDDFHLSFACKVGSLDSISGMDGTVRHLYGEIDGFKEGSYLSIDFRGVHYANVDLLDVAMENEFDRLGGFLVASRAYTYEEEVVIDNIYQKIARRIATIEKSSRELNIRDRRYARRSAHFSTPPGYRFIEVENENRKLLLSNYNTNLWSGIYSSNFRILGGASSYTMTVNCSLVENSGHIF